MPSKVMTGSEFSHELDLGLDLASYKYRFLVEGDSWMDRSSVLLGSLPMSLAGRFDAAGESALFINISTAGDTLRHIEHTMNGEFADWVERAFNWPFDAILFSAAGNDFIDAARDPAPGQGILRDMAGAGPNPQPVDCLDVDAIQHLVNQVLDPGFGAAAGA
jgi:hypothetical protein